MTSRSHSILEAAKKTILDKGLEEEFLKSAGLSSLDELDPKNFDFTVPSTPTTVMKSASSSAPVEQKKVAKKDADASTGFKPEVASDMLRPYVGLHINYVSRKKLSAYAPSCLMMDYILHNVNNFLVDNFYFKRAAPDYHPYILRLYYGVLFWIQCLRAAHDVRALDVESHQFLLRFLDAFPPESLTISSPLLDLFKTLCSSQPEISTYGKVYPLLPIPAGPEARSDFMRNHLNSFFVPNVPGIFALLEDLDLLINPSGTGATPVYPVKGKHFPVPPNATQAKVFGHHTFPAPATRTAFESWSLCSPGLQYLCEADRRLNESFAERYANFDFPTTAATDDLLSVEAFLGMETSLSWFSQVKEVAAIESAYFEGSGTLADCPPTGITSNQIVVFYGSPTTMPTAPTKSCDPAALFPFSVKLSTSSRTLPQLAEVMAATAQTNIQMFATHPRFPSFGAGQRTGGFWAIAPVETSNVDDTSYLGLSTVIRGLMKTKV